MLNYYELSYGEVLRELREFHDYKQKDISDYLNITSQAYSNYENNKRTPDVETLRKIAKFYGKTIDQLLDLRSTRQIEDSMNYAAGHSLYRAVSDNGITIPLTAKQAKIVAKILSLPKEKQDACFQIIEMLLINQNF